MFIIGVTGLCVTACISLNSGGSAFTETAAVCDTSGLETQYTSLKDYSKGWKGALLVGTPSGGGALGIERDRNNVERQTESLALRINRYDAEIDAQYRTVTNACKSYARCMQQNHHKEAKCRSNLARWETSEREFTNLSRDLREIDAEVENLRTVAKAGSKKGGHGRYQVNKCRKGKPPCY